MSSLLTIDLQTVLRMHYNLKEDNDFKQLYIAYFAKLVRFAKEYVFSEEDAENIIQDVFLIVWDKRDSLDYLENIQAFLFRLTKNKCVDFLRHKIMSAEKKEVLRENLLQEYTYNLLSMEQFDENRAGGEDMDKTIEEAISSLPEKCREIFILSRFEGMSHQEIAKQLQLSPSTVNNQISMGMKKLKRMLKDHLYIFFLLFINDIF